MKAPVGLLSDRTVLHSKMEGLCPDKFLFAILLPSRFVAGTPQQDRVCEATNAPAGRLSGSPVLRSKIEGPRPDKATSKCGSVAEVQSRRNATFSRIEFVATGRFLLFTFLAFWGKVFYYGY